MLLPQPREGDSKSKDKAPARPACMGCALVRVLGLGPAVSHIRMAALSVVLALVVSWKRQEEPEMCARVVWKRLQMRPWSLGSETSNFKSVSIKCFSIFKISLVPFSAKAFCRIQPNLQTMLVCERPFSVNLLYQLKKMLPGYSYGILCFPCFIYTVSALDQGIEGSSPAKRDSEMHSYCRVELHIGAHTCKVFISLQDWAKSEKCHVCLWSSIPIMVNAPISSHC